MQLAADLQALISLVAHHGYAVIFPIALIEGPIIAIVGGFLVSTGAFSWYLMFIVLFLGDLVGDTLYYLMGYYGGRRFALRWGKYFGVTEEKIDAAGSRFRKHDWKIFLFGKSQVTGLPTGVALLFTAGLFKIPYIRYISINMLGSFVKIAALEAAGYYFGHEFLAVSHQALGFATLLFFAAAIIIGGLLLTSDRSVGGR